MAKAPSPLARGIVRLYPRAWRERYAAEMLAVLPRHHVTLWTYADLLLGALDAHLHRDLLPERMLTMTQRLRTSEITIFVAFVLFCLPWLALQRVRDPLPQWERAVNAHPAILWTFNALNLAGVVALIAVLVGGVPILASAVKQSYLTQRWWRLALLLAPFVLLAVLVVYGLLARDGMSQRVTPGNPNADLTPLAVVLQALLLVLGLAWVSGSVIAVALLVGHSAVSPRAMRFALWPAAVAVAGLALGWLATLALSLLLASAWSATAADIVNGGVLLAVMALAVALGVNALRQGQRAVRTA